MFLRKLRISDSSKGAALKSLNKILAHLWEALKKTVHDAVRNVWTESHLLLVGESHGCCRQWRKLVKSEVGCERGRGQAYNVFPMVPDLLLLLKTEKQKLGNNRVTTVY
jgi:hypothetical protein